MQPDLLLYENRLLFTHSVRGKCILGCRNCKWASPHPLEKTGCFLGLGFFFSKYLKPNQVLFRTSITSYCCRIWTLPSIDAAAGKLDEQLLPQLPCCCSAANTGSCQLFACWMLVVCDLSSAPASWLPSLRK